MRILSSILVLAAALLCALPAAAQTPEENAENFLKGLKGIDDSILGTQWARVTAGSKVIGFGSRKVVKATAPDGKEVYNASLIITLQTSAGKIRIQEDAMIDAAFRMLNYKFITKGKVLGIGDMNESASFKVAWTENGAEVEKKAGDQTSKEVFYCSLRTVSEPDMFAPNLVKKGPAKYAFSIIETNDGKPKHVASYAVEVKAKKKIDFAGKEVEAVVVVMGSSSEAYFTPEGQFIGRKLGPMVMQLVKTEEEAKKGLAAFDPKGTMDWKSRTSPQTLWRAVSYATFKKDRDLIESCFDWSKFMGAIMKARGMELPPEQLQQMVEMYKPQMIEQMLQSAGDLKGYYLLLVEYMVNVKKDGETKAVIQIAGQKQKFMCEKTEDGWKVTGLQMGG